MSANGNASTLAKECPVCQDPFDTGANLPKVFGSCGHTVCAVCVPGCIDRQERATCPLCREETPVPPNGFPTIYLVKDILESQQASDAESVKCSACNKNAPSSDVFACKACTASENKIVLICSKCVVKAHKAHDVVEYDAMAKAVDFIAVMRDERQHNDTVQRHTTELTSTIAQEMKRLAKDCQVDVDADLPLSLMTKEEHDKHVDKSSERRLRSTRALDAAERIIARCRQELSGIRTDDAQPSGMQQTPSSDEVRGQKRVSPSTAVERAGAHTSLLDITNLQDVLAQSPLGVRVLFAESMSSALSLSVKRQMLKSFMELHAKRELTAQSLGVVLRKIRDREANGTKRTKYQHFTCVDT